MLADIVENLFIWKCFGFTGKVRIEGYFRAKHRLTAWMKKNMCTSFEPSHIRQDVFPANDIHLLPKKNHVKLL